MKYLLDVNALIALGYREHEFHRRVAGWVRAVARNELPELATCSITELGFVRIMANASQYRLAVSEARTMLLRLKKAGAWKFAFVVDDLDISSMPAWVKTAAQTTDGHLQQFVLRHGAILATLDERIPGSFLIPVAL